MASLAETNYCETENFDPQDPRCAKVLLTGKLLKVINSLELLFMYTNIFVSYIKVDKSTPEYRFGLFSLFSRHPSMKDWPAGKFILSQLSF